jgi:hypothetical protein
MNLERAIENLPCLLAARCGGDSLSHKGDWQAREKRRTGEKEKEKYQAWLFFYSARLALDKTRPAMI